MKPRILFLICVVLIASLVAIGAAGYAQKSASQRTTWEYRVEDSPNVGRLNELGTQGWELTAVSGSSNGVAFEYFFKRPR